MAHSSPSTNEAKAGGEIGRHSLPPWKLRPCALGFAILALAIFLGSATYNLSRLEVYSNHTVRVYMAKMWLETRSARTVTDVLRRVTTEWPPISATLNDPEQLSAFADQGPVEQDLSRLPSPAPLVSLIPARSPPLGCFCLA